MENLTNKVALVTGGSRGIGRATAIALAKEGVKIAITGRHFEALQETLDMLETDATAVVCDMQKEEDIKAAVEHTLDTFGQIDILVNNAGIMKTNLFLKTSAEEMREMLETNVMGTFTMMQQVLPHMIEQKSGTL